MITVDDILEIGLDNHEIHQAVIAANSRLKGGVSGSRQNRQDRMANLYRDNLVGAVGEVALCKYLYGNLMMFRLSQFLSQANEMFNVGDGGFDIPGLNVDVKSTFIRGKKDVLTYHLAVNSREFKPNWNYVLALVEGNEEAIGNVYLAGWLCSSELDRLATPNETFANSRAVKAELLNPLPRFSWFL